MATIQVRIDDNMKQKADSLFSDLGLDTSTAVRIFIAAAIENNGLPFAVKRFQERKPNAELREAMEDVRLNRNLHGPYSSAEEAVCSITPLNTSNANQSKFAKMYPLLGCAEGKIKMADDFDAPLLNPSELTDDDLERIRKKRESLRDCMKGEIWMADDFDAPLEEIQEYM